MADARGAWNETGDKLAALGRKLKVHYETQHGADGEQSREELTDAARKVGSALQDAFEAMGSAARDKAVQADVKQVSQSLVEALGATLGQASEELRRAFSERKGDLTHEPSEPAAPPSPLTAPAAGEAAPAAAEPTPAAGEAGEPPAESGPGVEPWGTP